MSIIPLQRSAYGIDFSDPRHFTSPKDIQNALEGLARYLTKDNFARVLEDLLFEKALAIELVLAGLPDSLPLNVWIIKNFPATFIEYDASIASKILLRLSLFFIFHRLGIDSELLSRYHRDVEATPKLLSTLSSLHFGDDQSGNDVEEDVDPNPHFFKIKARGKTKRSRQVANALMLSNSKSDTKILSDFSFAIPHNQEEVEEVRSQVIANAKSILQFFLTTIRGPDIVDYLQKTFLASDQSLSPVEILSPIPEVTLDEAIGAEAKASSAYPLVQPMKSALHFNSVVGFGEWRILISTRADRDLREGRRRDPKTFKITVKKIRELSNGHFSDNNQKRLNGPKTDVPIFEAKMTRDTRLVYQVDSVSDYDSQVERQVLRIFGIYTHAQLDNRLWESIGRQLGSKGKEYRRRCIYRERATGTSDSVFRPASFPPLETEATEIMAGMSLPPDDLEQELLHSILADLDVAFPFQVSPHEREIIEHRQSCYVLGRSGTGKTTTMLFKMLWIERTFQTNSNDVPRPRQMFVTKSRVLAGKVEEYFLKLLESLNVTSQSPENLRKLVLAKRNQTDDDNLVDLDDEDNWRSDLPRKFSELQDSHFPLFLTFDRLCDLIEADFDVSEKGYSHKENQEPRTFVSYELFQNHYWPHFPQRLIKGLDPALVFSEVMGIIKGSENTTTSDRGYLDRKTYEELSERTQSTFATQRSTIYSIFEAYQIQKRQQENYDAADRAHGILRVFRTPSRGMTGQKVDYIYVDEAQDNLLIDALLLRSLCHNKDGLFWAGDTAQTISVGSAFRFNDLKAFLFRVEKHATEKLLFPKTFVNISSQSPPKTFQLATNYRSHSGIVNCAQSVIELITNFWPYSIDTLAPEKGIVDGLRPIFLNGWNDDNVRYEQFLFGSSGSHIEFGAQQCILVRNESARLKLQEQVGNVGLIMTLYDSKGLEFNDVLLFNFFEDSSVDSSQWRLLLTATNSVEITEGSIPVAAPQFDRIRHASICAELKFLYVAITRARKNLWIADQSSKGEPMRVFWTKRNLVHNCTPCTDMPRLAVSSSREEWASKGKELFERKKFFQAKHCYERASMPREMAIANAYYLRGEARKIPSGDSRHLKEQRHREFIKAAEAFLGCAQEAGKNRTVYFRCAAECLELAAEVLQAANTYLEAHEYNIAAKLFRKLGLFDEAVDVIKTCKEYMQSDIVENIKEVARLFYFREERLEKARELFSTDEEELEYLEDLDLGITRAKVLVSLGRPAKAAALHLDEGRTEEAIPLFLQDSLWDSVSYGTVPGKNGISRFIDWSNCLNVDLIDFNDLNEISMFKAIIAYDKFNLARLAHVFLGTSNTSAATLCLYHYFRIVPRLRTMTSEDLAEILHLFLAYIRLLYELAFQLDPRVPSVQTLFGIRYTSSVDDFFIPSGTFLYNILIIKRWGVLSEGISIVGWELCQTLSHALRGELQARILEQIDQCRHATQFSPCLTYNTQGKWYNTRVRLNLQQVLILQTLYSTGAAPTEKIEMKKMKRIYLSQLYEAFNPPFFYLGTQTLLHPESIPEFQRGIQVVKEWLRDVTYSLDIHPQTLFLTNFLRISNLALVFDPRDALKFLWNAPCLFPPFVAPPYLRAHEGGFMLCELLGFLDGSKEWSISAGFLSVCHIIDSKLPINISDICTLIEHLCGACVISYGQYRKRGFHGVTLPRSWLLHHLSHQANAQVKFVPPYPYVMPRIAVLLETIYSGSSADYLLFGNSNLANISGVRAVFITRMCVVEPYFLLFLVGYNIPQLTLRTSIQRVLASINRIDRKFHHLYRDYVCARGWGELVRALRKTPQGSLVDELVQLHDLGREAVPSRPVHGVRIVPFKVNEDLLQLLGASSLPLEETASSDSNVLQQEQEPLIAAQAEDSTEHGVDLVELDELEETHEGEIDGTAEGDGFGDNHSHMIISADMPQAQPPSEDEQHAALMILKIYRRIRLRRGHGARTRSTPSIIKIFVACLKLSPELSWDKNPSYRFVYLWSLPHLLVCFDIAHAATSSQKRIFKKHLLEDRHENLDRLGNRMNEIVKLAKHLRRLQKTLEPTSELHRRCDIAELRRAVEETVELLQAPLFATLEGLQKNLDIAVKGILTPRQPPKTLPKPDLVWEEDI
ncbi:TPR and ankyrin repeat-containing protein 1 [Termitomyces sp. J132]|nr:TPR and ankyrin repeat-containing protein 1 [Termitomyces sp. J132]